MNTYKYTAKDKNSITVSGILESASDIEAADILHKKDLTIVSIESIKYKSKGSVDRTTNVKSEELVIFARQLATMIDAGIPLVHSLSILAEQIENKSLNFVVMTVSRDIEAGMSFSEALAKHPGVFSGLFLNMVRAGETSGLLNEVLDRLALYLEKSAALNRKIRSSLIYPASIVSVAIVITAILLLKVVPTFKGIFEVLGGSLPFPTQVLIGTSDFLRKNILYVLGFLVIASFLFKRYINTENGCYWFDARKLQFPVLGPLLRKVAVAKFARTFSTLVKSGVSILNALEIVGKTSGNRIVEEAVKKCSEAVRNGEPISRPLSKSGVFPPMVCRMINVGEQTGQLEKMLTKIADFYDDQVDTAAATLTSMIEPMVIVFLGVVIGGIVISLFLPIFKISQLMTR